MSKIPKMDSDIGFETNALGASVKMNLQDVLANPAYSTGTGILPPLGLGIMPIIFLCIVVLMTIFMLVAYAMNHPTASAHLYNKVFAWADNLLKSIIDPPMTRRMYRWAIRSHLEREEFEDGRLLALETDMMEVVNEYLEQQRRFLEAARGWVLEQRPDRARELFAKAVEQAVQEGLVREAVNYALEGELFDRAVELALASDAPAVRIKAAEAYKNMERFDDAINLYLREQDESSAVQTAIEAKLFDKAAEICRNSYETSVQQMEADVYRAAGDLQKALNLYMEYGIKDKAQEVARELDIEEEASEEEQPTEEEQVDEQKKKTSVELVIPEYKPAPKIEMPDKPTAKDPFDLGAFSDGTEAALGNVPPLPGFPPVPGVSGGAARDSAPYPVSDIPPLPGSARPGMAIPPPASASGHPVPGSGSGSGGGGSGSGSGGGSGGGGSGGGSGGGGSSGGGGGSGGSGGGGGTGTGGWAGKPPDAGYDRESTGAIGAVPGVPGPEVRLKRRMTSFDFEEAEEIRKKIIGVEEAENEPSDQASPESEES